MVLRNINRISKVVLKQRVKRRTRASRGRGEGTTYLSLNIKCCGDANWWRIDADTGGHAMKRIHCACRFEEHLRIRKSRREKEETRSKWTWKGDPVIGRSSTRTLTEYMPRKFTLKEAV